MWKRRSIWIILTILTVTAITVYGGIVSYSLFYACILIPLISGIYLLYVYMRFTIYQSIDTRNIICRQPVPYSFILHNEAFTVYTGIGINMYSKYSHVDNMEDGKKYRLFPGDKIEIESELTCKYRGEYEVGVKEIVVYDFFGLFCVRYKIPSVIKALVTPRIIRLSELNSIPQLVSAMEKETFHEASEMDVIVRDYVYGDSLRKIHWKQTAKEGTLKVRNQIGIRKQKMSVLFSTQRIDEKEDVYLPAENKVLETVIALIYYFIEQNAEIQLLWQGKGIEKRDILGYRHFETILSELSALIFNEEYKLIHAAGEVKKMQMMHDSYFLFFVAETISHNLVAVLAELAGEEKMVILYVITDEDISEYMSQSNNRLQIMSIGPEQELNEVL